MRPEAVYRIPTLQEGPQWVGIAVRFAGNDEAPQGRWLTMEFDAANVEVNYDRGWDDGLGYYRPGMPVRVMGPSRMNVTVSGYSAARSTWPNWFPDAGRREESAADVAAAFDRSRGRGVTRRPHIIGGDLAAGGERPRKGGWL